MRYFCGIDIGSVSTKVVFIDEEGKVAAQSVRASMPDPGQTYTKCLAECFGMLECGIEDVLNIVSVGYGKKLVKEPSAKMSEITALAKGINHINPRVRSIIDVGGEDSKAVVIDENGLMVDFAMNDKCSAGTGRFLETTSKILDISLDELSDCACESDKKIALSSTCTVFAISEINSLLSKDGKKNDIAMAIVDSICFRLAGLANSVGTDEVTAFTGGVANIRVMREKLSQMLNRDIFVHVQPQTVTALGAAILAKTKYTNDQAAT